MSISDKPAAVIGSGPNGLAAAVTLARAGVPVTVYERAATMGGGTRTSEYVEPGVLHDVCSAIHPMAIATPFFREFELERRIEFAIPDVSYAHPLDDRAVLAHRSLDATVAELGRDGAAYRNLYTPLLKHLEGTIDFSLAGSMWRFPRDLPATIALGLRVLEQGTPLWNARFREDEAPALLTGVAGHSVGKMPHVAGAGVALVLGALGHAGGWAVPIGGSRSISGALAADLIAHGGVIETDREIEHIRELDGHGTVIFDTSARDLARIAGARLPPGYARKLRKFTYGDGATKVDFVLDDPIPWRDERVRLAPTVHIGGTRQEIMQAEAQVARGQHPDRPYLIVAQTDEFDTARNPAGKHAIWCYTHVPKGSNVDVSEAVIAQIERFAPGFRDRVQTMRVTTAAELAEYNPNYHGGDFSAGAITLKQLLARPTIGSEPWATPVRGIYLASSSTPPGPGVHGLSGWYAARVALRREYGLEAPSLRLT